MTWSAFLAAAPALSAVIALVTFVVGTVIALTNAKRESDRRDWERLQALTQVLHSGHSTGLWAQKLAIQELAKLKTKKIQALILLRDALAFWEAAGTASHDLLNELRTAIAKLSP
jgi:hypothetical protein